MNKRYLILAFASHGRGISGGDRIFIELSRQLSNRLHIDIHTWIEGEKLIRRQNLEASKDIRLINHSFIGLVENGNFLVNYILRVLLGVYFGLTYKLCDQVYIYSASEFWMDVFPSYILKIRYPNKVCWIATWYQTAPNPLKGFSEGGEREDNFKVRAFLYWIAQQPSKLLIQWKADKVVVNNTAEIKRFSTFNKKNIFVMIGAVPLAKIDAFISKNKKTKKKYDAVFQGRFHAQKGVLELIDIWNKVVERNPSARLAMIGDGPLMERVQERIEKYNIRDNIRLFGYVNDGDKKFKIFAQSKIVVHPAYYDSGGMASAEAMAFGIPCVGFDLVSYTSYYPKGMIKVSKGDKIAFSKKILKLLESQKLRISLGKEARSLIISSYSWKYRANTFYKFITSK